MDVGEDTSLGDDDVSEKAVKLLVVADRELEVAGNDARLLVVTSGGDGSQPSRAGGEREGRDSPSGVTGKLEDLGRQVLEDSG